jgi:acetyl esterase
MTKESKPADAVVAAFIADSDAVFTPAYDALPMAEQRAIYDAFWRRYHAPHPKGVSVETVMIPAEGRDLRALLYRPPQRSANREPLPAVVYFHGGGWMLGSPESHDLPGARLCAEAGVAVLNLDYRLAPENVFPDALMDCLAAVQWVARSGRGGRGSIRTASPLLETAPEAPSLPDFACGSGITVVPGSRFRP